ncbi:MAG: hypothetical protein GXO98_03635 [Nitrospirae bacterium]|nr:hypothetical protein [Nitrospirota bacterium]
MKKLFLVGFLALVSVLAFWPGQARGQMGKACPTNMELFPNDAYKEAGQVYFQTDESGKARVEVTYVSPRFFETLKAMKDEIDPARLAMLEKYWDGGKNILFVVGLTTHVGSQVCPTLNLSKYRMKKISFLRDAWGKEYKAVGWKEGLSDMPSMPNHHRVGILIFSGDDARGNPVISNKAKFMELVIKGLAGAKKRTFKWNLPLE